MEDSENWELLTNLPPEADECELENMISEKAYYLRIRAENRHGVGLPKELSQPIRVHGDKKGDYPLDE